MHFHFILLTCSYDIYVYFRRKLDVFFRNFLLQKPALMTLASPRLALNFSSLGSPCLFWK